MKNIIIAILGLAVVGLCCVVAIQRTDKRKEAEFRLFVDKAMYEAAQRGDLEKVRSSVCILLLGDVRYCERKYGVPSGTDRYARDFAAAQAMAQDIERGLVPFSSITTNPAVTSKMGSNVSIVMEPEK